jgi:hypothetical protein
VRLLLDTQIMLWALTGSTRLGKAARELIADPANDIYVGTRRSGKSPSSMHWGAATCR